jgi:chromosomal replication initiation ATPase DnaA
MTRDILGVATPPKRVPVREILRRIATETGVPAHTIYGPAQDRKTARIRQRVYAEAYAAGHSSLRIGRALARDHSTVLFGIRAHREREAKNGAH